MTLATLKSTLHSLNEGTGHQANLDILMEKRNFPPIYQSCTGWGLPRGPRSMLTMHQIQSLGDPEQVPGLSELCLGILVEQEADKC